MGRLEGSQVKTKISNRIQNEVIMREKEVEVMEQAYKEVLAIRTSALYVYGDIGVGKSSTVYQNMLKFSQDGATCVHGKADQFHNEEPYVSIIQIIDQMIDHFLTLPDVRLSIIKQQLNEALKKDGVLLAEIIPRITLVLGHNSKVSLNDYQKLKTRIERAFQNFIEVAAKVLFPLIIFIDDIQWLDQASWNILKLLGNTTFEKSCLFIMAFRNDDRKKALFLKEEIEELFAHVPLRAVEIEPFDFSLLGQFLENVFEGKVAGGRNLKEILFINSLGNPLTIKQLLEELVEKGWLYYLEEDQLWHLSKDLTLLPEAADHIEVLLKEKMDKLDQWYRKLLAYAACLGSQFSLEALSKALDTKEGMLIEALNQLSLKGFIHSVLSTQEEESGEYCFLHDRIYKCVYDSIPSKVREEIYYQISLALLFDSDKNFVENQLFRISGYVLHCEHLLRTHPDLDAIRVSMYFAACKAKRVIAWEHAYYLFSFCQRMLPLDAWETDYEMTYKVIIGLAQSEFICGHYEDAKGHFELLLSHTTDTMKLAEIKRSYCALFVYTGNHEAVIEQGLEGLAYLGIHYSKRFKFLMVLIEVVKSLFLFRNKRLSKIQNAPIIIDEGVGSSLKILTTMIASANLINEDLFSWIVLKSSNLCAKYGNNLYSPAAYAAYSLVVCRIIGDYKKAKAIKNIALRLTEIMDTQSMMYESYFCLGNFVEHWFSPIDESIKLLDRCFDSALLAGDYLYCAYASTAIRELQCSKGIPLHKLFEIVESSTVHGKKMDNDILLRSNRIFKQHIEVLQGETIEENNQAYDTEMENLNSNENMIYYLLKLQRSYLEERYDVSELIVRKTVKRLESITGYIIEVDFLFYMLLVHYSSQLLGQGNNLLSGKIVKKFSKSLKEWANLCPENHGFKYQLIAGLGLYCKDKKYKALILFEEAIQNAKENNHLLITGIGCRLVAKLYKDNETISRMYAQRAYENLLVYGSILSANALVQEYDLSTHEKSKELIEQEKIKLLKSHGRLQEKSSRDALSSHQKQFEMADLSTCFEYYLSVVYEMTGYAGGAILTEICGEMYYQETKGDYLPNLKVNFETFELVPKRILRYVNRTYEEVIIYKKPLEGPYITDGHIKHKEQYSIICLPLKYNNVFSGIVYFEFFKDNVFDSQTVDFIKRLSFLLFTRVAISSEIIDDNRALINQKIQLTEREKDVLELMAEGLSNGDIGKRLFVSSSTVKTHTLNLYGKLEVENRMQAVLKAQKMNII